MDVGRNDAWDWTSTDAYSHIVLSPGPGLPQASGCLMALIEQEIGKKPILGVCLGMQALALHLGDELYNLPQVRHGIAMGCEKRGESHLLRGLEQNFIVGLYHSWAVEGKSESFSITSISKDGVIMSIEAIDKKVYGVQFHPESVMTPEGKRILKNFLETA